MSALNREAWIEYRPMSEIQFADRNPRQHDLGAIHQSLTRFGFINPVVINEANEKLVAGHGRLIALKQKKDLGENPPARIKVIDGEWHVPVVRGADFENELEAEAYLVADNRLTELSGWDDSGLAATLKDLATDSVLDGVGYDTDDLDALLNDLNPNFMPTDEEPPRLDQKAPIICPNCSHEFTT